MKKVQGIYEKEVRVALLNTFKQVRKDLSPLLDNYKFYDITLYWWIKKIKKEGVMGMCYKGVCKIPGIRGWRKNVILLFKNYYETNGMEDLLGVWRHELVHLVAKDSHGENFKSLASACGAKRHCPQNK